MRTVYPIGTTLYQPDRCDNGYTLLWHWNVAKLVDMNGRTVREWPLAHRMDSPGMSRAHLLPNGHVLMQRGGMHSTDGVLQEVDWDNNLVWEWIPEGGIPHENLMGPHHDCFRKDDGNTLTVCREPAPREVMATVEPPEWRSERICGDAIVEVNPAGDVVWIWHSHDHLDINHKRLLASPEWKPGKFNSTVCDWTHVNTARPLPENKWFDAGDERFRPGNVMISPRQLDTIYLIDRATGAVLWEYTGDYFGGLSGQHEPYMIPKGLPGAGNVLVFDNGASPWNDLGHAGSSYVLEIDPTTKEVVWAYDRWIHFFSPYTSSAQRLPNGNTMICASLAQRVFEVTPDGETVWEHVEGTPRAYRYPYDFTPQLAALGTPKECSVTPPKELRIAPDQARS